MADIMDGMSMNLEQANIDKLKAVFPECFAEGKLDIDKLLSLCGEYIAVRWRNAPPFFSYNGKRRTNGRCL